MDAFEGFVDLASIISSLPTLKNHPLHKKERRGGKDGGPVQLLQATKM